MRIIIHRTLRGLAAASLAGALAGCVSFGSDPPDLLLTMEPATQAAPGTGVTGPADTALAVMVPGSPQKLNVTRVPVQVSDSSLAYLQDAVWVEKPTRLFQSLLAETIRARGDRLVVDSGDLQYSAVNKLSGQLLDLGYDAATGSVVMRFDAVLQDADGEVRSQRFETRIPGIAPDAQSVAPALNRAANTLAAEIADWVG